MHGKQILSILTQLENTSSRSGKLKILAKYKSHKVFIMALYYTYNPFLRYHIRAIPDDVVGCGDKDLSIKTWELLTALSNRSISGVAARRTLFSYINTLTPAAGEVVRRVVKKKLRCGVSVKSINAIHPKLIPDHSVMKAYDYEEKHLPESFFVSPKIDGIRASFRGGKLYFRSGREVKGVGHITKLLNKYERYDGELEVPGVGFDVSSGIIRSDDSNLKPKIVYHIFDCRTNPDLPLVNRLEKLNQFELHGVCRRTPHVPVINHPHPLTMISEFYQNARTLGYEGIMIKDAAGIYEPKRSRLWMKLKPFEDAEFKVIGLFEGQGKFKDMLGGIVIKVGGVKVRVGGGFSNYQRESFWRWPNKIMGESVTIKYMEKTANGSLRHPEFKAIRRDL